MPQNPKAISSCTKTVSFGGTASNDVYTVTNYKLELVTPEERSAVWYEPAELDIFARDEFLSHYNGSDRDAHASIAAMHEMSRNHGLPRAVSAYFFQKSTRTRFNKQ